MLHQDNKCVTAKAVSSEKWHIFSTLNYLLISARSRGEAAERREERRRTLSASTELNVWDAWEMKQHLSPSFVFHFLICTKLEWKVCFEDLNLCAYQCLRLDDCKFAMDFVGISWKQKFSESEEPWVWNVELLPTLLRASHVSSMSTTVCIVNSFPKALSNSSKQNNDIRSRPTIQTLNFDDFMKIRLCGGTEKFLSQRNLFYW